MLFCTKKGPASGQRSLTEVWKVVTGVFHMFFALISSLRADLRLLTVKPCLLQGLQAHPQYQRAR